jgi:hypothetical protein
MEFPGRKLRAAESTGVSHVTPRGVSHYGHLSTSGHRQTVPNHRQAAKPPTDVVGGSVGSVQPIGQLTSAASFSMISRRFADTSAFSRG